MKGLPRFPEPREAERIARLSTAMLPGAAGGRFESVAPVAERPRGRVLPPPSSGSSWMQIPTPADQAEWTDHPDFDPSVWDGSIVGDITDDSSLMVVQHEVADHRAVATPKFDIYMRMRVRDPEDFAFYLDLGVIYNSGSDSYWCPIAFDESGLNDKAFPGGGYVSAWVDPGEWFWLHVTGIPGPDVGATMNITGWIKRDDDTDEQWVGIGVMLFSADIILEVAQHVPKVTLELYYGVEVDLSQSRVYRARLADE